MMKEILENLSLIAQIISFPIAAIAIFISVKTSKRDRDVSLIISLSETFRDRWENKWRATVQEFEALPEGQQPDETQLNELLNLLNWIDWLGWLIENKVIHKHAVILNSIGPVLSRAIKAGAPILKKGTELYDTHFWAGVLIVEKLVSKNTMHNHDTQDYLALFDKNQKA